MRGVVVHASDGDAAAHDLARVQSGDRVRDDEPGGDNPAPRPEKRESRSQGRRHPGRLDHHVRPAPPAEVPHPDACSARLEVIQRAGLVGTEPAGEGSPRRDPVDRDHVVGRLHSRHRHPMETQEPRPENDYGIAGLDGGRFRHRGHGGHPAVDRCHLVVRQLARHQGDAGAWQQVAEPPEAAEEMRRMERALVSVLPPDRALLGRARHTARNARRRCTLPRLPADEKGEADRADRGACLVRAPR